MTDNVFTNSWKPLIWSLCMGLILSSCAMLPETLYDLNNQSSIPTNDLIGQISNHRVIFVGEAHDSDIDHAMQLEVIQQLQESGRPIVVGLEVFPALHQPFLDGWVNKKINEDEFISVFNDAWSVPYAYYQAIILYARQHGIRLLGLNISKERFNKLSKYGIGAELVKTLRDLKFSSCTQEIEYAIQMRTYMSRLSHKGNLNRMCDTQRFREAFMAKQIVDFVDSSEEAMVLLMGSAHAKKNAVPEMLRRHGKQDYLVLLPDNFSDLSGAVITKKEGDFVW